MDLQSSSRELGSNILEQAREGTVVYDVNDQVLGHVDDLYLGASSEQLNERGEGSATAPSRSAPGDSLADHIASAFAPNNLPEELRAHLLHEGFIRIKTGPGSERLYALPRHIVSVTRDRINLNTDRFHLIKNSYDEG